MAGANRSKERRGRTMGIRNGKGGVMGSIVLAEGNAKALFAPAGQEPASDADLVRLVDPRTPLVSPFDYAVTRGDGVFEATTVWKGFPVSLENHLHRLAHSAAMMDMPAPNETAFRRAIDVMSAAYDDPQPGPLLRILVSRGMDRDTGVGLATAGEGDAGPHVWMFLDPQGAQHSVAPITMATLSRGYRSDIAGRAPWLLNGAKTLSYAINMAAHRECDRRGVDDALFVTEDGFTLECPNSSIVARYGDELVTPDPSIGILHGTTQREMFAYAMQEGGRARYLRRLPLAQLREADRLYMVHGGWVIPVRELDGRAYDVDTAEIDAVNDAIHAGRTHDDALEVGPGL